MRKISRSIFSKTAIASALLVTVPMAGAASNEELQTRVDELQAQVAELVKAMKANEAKVEQVATQQKAAPKSQSGSLLGNTTITVGGYMKLDSQFSTYSDGNGATAGIGEDFLVPSTIPVGGEESDTEYHSHAKTSRLFVKSRTETENGFVATHVEFDAVGSAQGDERISNSYSERVRHAYVNWQIDEKNALLAGQTWSTFFNVGALPEGLDFVGPVGTIFERQPQIRYTRQLNSGSLQIAAENPASTLYGGAENPYDDNGQPDMIVRYNGTQGGLSYTLAAMAREIRCEDGVKDESANGMALSLSGKYQFGRDDVRFMFNYGDALGRYMGLNGFRAGQIEADGSIELIDQYGAVLAFRHFWNDQWRSNFTLSMTEADNPDSVTDTTAKAYSSVHANLLYSPVKSLTLGAEYIHAVKELENVSGTLVDDEGNLKRLQISMKYAF